MKKRILFIAMHCCFLSLFLSGQTVITEFTQNTTLDLADSPYQINGVSIPAGITITILPGVEISGQLFVSGTLIAEGLIDNPINFPNTDISFQPGSENSKLRHAIFDGGGAFGTFEFGAVTFSTDIDVFDNLIFKNCDQAVMVYDGVNMVFDNLIFEDNGNGLAVQSMETSVSNCRFLNNTESGLAVLAASNEVYDAKNNWWGVEDYLAGRNNSEANLTQILDNRDIASFPVVDFTPMLSPQIELQSISPRSALTFGSTTVEVTGYLFDEQTTLSLVSNDAVLLPTDYVNLDSFNITATFDFDMNPSGFYDVVVINPSFTDTLRLEAGFSLLDVPSVPFGEWVPFEATTGEKFVSQVEIPDISPLFIFLKKATRVGYSSTYAGELKLISHNDTTIFSDLIRHTNNSHTDINFETTAISPGVMFFEISAEDVGEGQIIFTDSPPEFELNEWTSGEILRPYGYDWKKVVVPSGLDFLDFRTEGYGMWSTLEVFVGSIANPEQRYTLSNQGINGFRIERRIENPPPGVYYLRYKDSAVFYEQGNAFGYTNISQLRTYFLHVTAQASAPPSPQPLSITNVHPAIVGQEISTIELSGTAFNETAVVTLNGPSGNIEALKTSLTNEGTLKATFDFSVVGVGEYETIVNQDNGTVNFQDGLTVEQTTQGEIEVNIITSPTIRAGRNRPFLIQFNNTSNIDYSFVLVDVKFDGNPQVNIGGTGKADPAEVFPDLDFDDFDGLNDWDDIPESITWTDSTTMEVFTTVPVIIPRIPAGSVYEMELTVRYAGQETAGYEVNVVGSLFNDSALNYEEVVTSSANACGGAVFDLATTFLTNLVPGRACAAGFLGFYAQLASSGLVSLADNRPMNFGSALLGFSSASLTCILDLGSIALPAARVLNALNKTAEALGTASTLNDIADNCFPNPPPRQGTSRVITSTTPEDKFGPAGAEQSPDLPLGEKSNFVQRIDNYNYRIDYWNKADATAPAAEVFIRDTLDEKFDLTTFKFTGFGFLEWDRKFDGAHFFDIDVDLRPNFPYIVNVEATLNPETREVYWVHRTLDPETGELPDDPFAGYLPPIDSDWYNLGYVNFSVRPESSIADGDQLKNQAFVNFDGVGVWGPAPPYGPYTNTLDLSRPTGGISDVILTDSTVILELSGTDGDGSGIANYDIYLAPEGEPYRLVEPFFSGTALTLELPQDTTYLAYALARDRVGNLQVWDNQPQQIFQLLNNTTDYKLDHSNVLNISPNPTSGQFNFKLNATISDPSITLEIFSAGKKVSEKMLGPIFIGQNNFTVNMEGFSKGNYELRVVTSGYRYIGRVVILR